MAFNPGIRAAIQSAVARSGRFHDQDQGVVYPTGNISSNRVTDKAGPSWLDNLAWTVQDARNQVDAVPGKFDRGLTAIGNYFTQGNAMPTVPAPLPHGGVGGMGNPVALYDNAAPPAYAIGHGPKPAPYRLSPEEAALHNATGTLPGWQRNHEAEVAAGVGVDHLGRPLGPLGQPLTQAGPPSPAGTPLVQPARAAAVAAAPVYGQHRGAPLAPFTYTPELGDLKDWQAKDYTGTTTKMVKGKKVVVQTGKQALAKLTPRDRNERDRQLQYAEQIGKVNFALENAGMSDEGYDRTRRLAEQMLYTMPQRGTKGYTAANAEFQNVIKGLIGHYTGSAMAQQAAQSSSSFPPEMLAVIQDMIANPQGKNGKIDTSAINTVRQLGTAMQPEPYVDPNQEWDPFANYNDIVAKAKSDRESLKRTSKTKTKGGTTSTYSSDAPTEG